MSSHRLDWLQLRLDCYCIKIPRCNQWCLKAQSSGIPEFREDKLVFAVFNVVYIQRRRLFCEVYQPVTPDERNTDGSAEARETCLADFAALFCEECV